MTTKLTESHTRQAFVHLIRSSWHRKSDFLVSENGDECSVSRRAPAESGVFSQVPILLRLFTRILQRCFYRCEAPEMFGLQITSPDLMTHFSCLGELFAQIN